MSFFLYPSSQLPNIFDTVTVTPLLNNSVKIGFSVWGRNVPTWQSPSTAPLLFHLAWPGPPGDCRVTTAEAPQSTNTITTSELGNMSRQAWGSKKRRGGGIRLVGGGQGANLAYVFLFSSQKPDSCFCFCLFLTSGSSCNPSTPFPVYLSGETRFPLSFRHVRASSIWRTTALGRKGWNCAAFTHEAQTCVQNHPPPGILTRSAHKGYRTLDVSCQFGPKGCRWLLNDTWKSSFDSWL